MCLIIASSALLPFYAYANTRVESAEVELLQDGDFDIVTDSQSASLLSDVSDIDAITAAIYNCLSNSSYSVSLSTYSLPVQTFLTIYTNVVNDNADLFYVSSTISYSYTNSGGVKYVTTIYPKYIMGVSQIASARTIFNAGVEKALSLVSDDMTDMQIALVLHDYLCCIARYPGDINTNDKQIYHSAYGVFYDGNTVCAGYSLAYSYLLKQCGIESEYIISSGMTHAWNAVKIGGNWYNVDLTYDDISHTYGDINCDGAVMHNWFLKSDAYFEGAQGLYHFDKDAYDDVACTDTSLDSAFWDKVTSRIYVLDGKYCYLQPSSNGFSVSLIERDTNGNQRNLYNGTISSVKSTLTLYANDSSGVKRSIPIVDTLCRLTYLDGKFYISADKYLYCIVDGEKYTVTGLGNYITGLGNNGQEIQYIRYQTTTLLTVYKLVILEDAITFDDRTNYNPYPDVDNNGYVNAIDYSIIVNY